MKRLVLYILLLFCSCARAQDKIYLMDGNCKVVKVLEVGPDYLTVVPLSESGAPFVDANENIQKKDIILVEFKGGHIEIYNQPAKTLVYSPNGKIRKEPKEERDLLFNFASINTLALCNADISGFYERLNTSKKIGLGFMAAYNFNPYVISPNVFLAILSNAKKNYDLGAFVNLYPGHFRRRTTFYVGAMIKYTAFSFSKLEEEKVGTSVNIKYTPAKGRQLATIFDIGTHTYLSGNFFLKTIVGLGGFILRGDYKQQFNYYINKDKNPKDPTYNYSFLPKAYLGLNVGFNF